MEQPSQMSQYIFLHFRDKALMPVLASKVTPVFLSLSLLLYTLLSLILILGVAFKTWQNNNHIQWSKNEIRSRSQLCKSCQMWTWCIHKQNAFILESQFTSYHLPLFMNHLAMCILTRKTPNKTTPHQQPTNFRDIGSVCLWQVFTEWQNSWNYTHTNFKLCISCNKRIRLQEFNITTRFISSPWVVVMVMF